ncbi:MAG: MotA/TolQ/ExbB proton channel family protein [Kiritimatiellae bacterium]|nr:MotA/TolQ/ExbB proton channel family protein [Kiritimatiellia bacterium]
MKRLMNILLWSCLLGVVAVWAQAPDAAAGAEEAAKSTTLLDLIKVGGWAMWPLGACSFGLITVAVLLVQKINVKKLIPPIPLSEIKKAAQVGDLMVMQNVATASPSLFTNSLAAGLRKLNPDDPEGSKETVEGAIGEAVVREESAVAFWVNMLSLITAVSPMIGLLGTVSGMIGAFQKIGQGGMGKPELLAGNIGEALITTATGLIVAIPSMFCFFLFRNNLNKIVQIAEREFTEVLDLLLGSASEAGE